MTFKKIIIVIAILVAVGTGAAFIISTINDQSSLTVDKLLSLFFGNNLPSRDFTLGNEAFQVGQMGTPIPVTARDLTLPQLFTKVEKSVVQISSRSDSSIRSAARLGSGFIFDRNRHVITNYHVALGSKNIDVTFMDGNTYHANIVGSDPFTDLAVLYVQDVPKDTLFPLTLGNSGALDVGEQIAAIGDPFGLSGSMTAGIISGLGRLLPSTASLGSRFSIPSIIQIDAPINPGNSGGPLLDMRGEVVGINSAIFSSTGEFSGIGFAIPSNTISKVVPSLITKGSFSHPWIGLSGTNMTPEIANAIGLKESRGFLVVDTVSGSPAEKGGLHGGNKVVTINGMQIALGGDVIEKIDDKVVRKIDDILAYIESMKSVGENVSLTVLRDGKIQKLNLSLAPRPGFQGP
ncbi:MAG TPA: trypsin-like peptidase domain-containing protein [Nitrososphaeraceae archaeon]|nr:trypsin-like peptidase domain-containing protein [Nitrososphaeraceae archaeon]